MMQDWKVYFPPTGSILGGLVVQEVVKLLNPRDVPLMNFFTINVMQGNGIITNLGVKKSAEKSNEKQFIVDDDVPGQD